VVQRISAISTFGWQEAVEGKMSQVQKPGISRSSLLKRGANEYRAFLSQLFREFHDIAIQNHDDQASLKLGDIVTPEWKPRVSSKAVQIVLDAKSGCFAKLVRNLGFPKAIRRWAVVVVTTPPYTTPLHVDHGRTTCVEMLQGIKLWHLFPPATRPQDEGKVRAVDNISFRLTAGDQLYFPCGWQHAVETSGKEVAVLLNCCAIEPDNLDMITKTQLSPTTPKLVAEMVRKATTSTKKPTPGPAEEKKTIGEDSTPAAGELKQTPSHATTSRDRKRKMSAGGAPVPKSKRRKPGRKAHRRKRAKLSSSTKHSRKSCQAVFHPSTLPCSGRYVRLARVKGLWVCQSCRQSYDARMADTS
jgi:hypothetical protein